MRYFLHRLSEFWCPLFSNDRMSLGRFMIGTDSLLPSKTKRRRRVAARLASTAAALAWALGPKPVGGQEMPVSVREQAALFSRVIQFDRTFDSRSSNGLVVGILVDEASPASLAAKDEFSRALIAVGLVDLEGRPPRIVEVQMGPALGPTLESTQVDVLYVTALAGLDVPSVAAETRRLGVLSCSGVPEFARMGLAVAMDAQEGRPRFLINLPGTEAEGADFRPAFLKMAEIIRRAP